MKNKLILLTYIFLFFKCISAYSQTYTYYGDKAFGTDQWDYSPYAIYIGNGCFILAGYTVGNSNGDKTDPKCDTSNLGGSDIWILKIDTSFNIIWDKSYGGNNSESYSSIFLKQNSNQIEITCMSNSDSTCEKSSNNKSFPFNNSDYWISCIDMNGNQINDHTFGSLGPDYYPQTIELSSGNFITCGTSLTGIGGDKTVSNHLDINGFITQDYWVIKTDINGNKIWDKVYGGSGKEYGWLGVYFMNFSILSDKNDAFILAGTTDSPLSGDVSDTSRGMMDIWIIKIDSLGNKIWDKRFGGSGHDACNHIINTLDKGFLLCGTTNSPQGGDVSDTSKGSTDCWVIKLDSLGNKQWDKRFGGNSSEVSNWIASAPGGGYWISGSTSSDSSGDVSQPKYGTTADYWIFKIDEAGNKLFDRRFGGPTLNYGGPFIIMPDTSIYFFGSAFTGVSTVKSDSGRGSYDYWGVHFKYIDSVSSVGINEVANFSDNAFVFPNPVTDIIQIKTNYPKPMQMEVYNLMGAKLLETIVTANREIDISSLAKGMYVYKLKDWDKVLKIGKLLKE